MKSSARILCEQAGAWPHNAGTQNNLYEIPYDADRDWQSGQYHAVLDTTQFANGRFLFTVEVFDAAGKLLPPQGTAAPGRRNQYGRPLYLPPLVPGNRPHCRGAILPRLPICSGGTTRKADAEIVDLRKDHAPDTGRCANSFSALPAATSAWVIARTTPSRCSCWITRLWWHRGLGTATGVLTSPNPNPNNVGVPPNPPHEKCAIKFWSHVGWT